MPDQISTIDEDKGHSIDCAFWFSLPPVNPLPGSLKVIKAKEQRRKISHLNRIFLLEVLLNVVILEAFFPQPSNSFESISPLLFFNFLSYYNYWLLLLQTSLKTVLAKHSYIDFFFYYIPSYSSLRLDYWFHANSIIYI